MKILIIEDETPAAERLQKLIQKLHSDARILEVCESIESSIAYLNAHGNELDLIFMDINLADGNSFKIFDHIKINCPIVFTTAYEEFALQAFKIHALDYLLKPVKEADLEFIFKKLSVSDNKENEILKLIRFASENREEKRMILKHSNQFYTVKVSDIRYFYSENKIVHVVTEEKKYTCDYTIEKVFEILNPKQFFRINRQMIININSIQSMSIFSKGRMRLKLAPPFLEEVITSTDRSHDFKIWLESVQ